MSIGISEGGGEGGRGRGGGGSAGFGEGAEGGHCCEHRRGCRHSMQQMIQVQSEYDWQTGPTCMVQPGAALLKKQCLAYASHIHDMNELMTYGTLLQLIVLASDIAVGTHV